MNFEAYKLSKSFKLQKNWPWYLLEFFYDLKKMLLLPFSYLLTDLHKLWTKNFGFICSFTALQKE